MKNAIVSGIILVILFILVGVNTAVVDGMLDDTIIRVEDLELTDELSENFKGLQKNYEKRARYINLTVSHVMMAEVEQAFAEIEGAIEAGNTEGFIEAKSRLTDALGQLKRLAGVSLDSII